MHHDLVAACPGPRVEQHENHYYYFVSITLEGQGKQSRVASVGGQESAAGRTSRAGSIKVS